LTRKYVRRLDVEIEVADEQAEIALKVLRGMSDVVIGEPKKPNGALVVTINHRESIPDVLACMVQNQVRVYRLAPQEADLEQVYFTLHEEKEGVS